MIERPEFVKRIGLLFLMLFLTSCMKNDTVRSSGTANEITLEAGNGIWKIERRRAI